MLSNFDPKNIPPKFNPFRDGLIKVLERADHLSDADLKAKLAELLDIESEKYTPRKADIVLKQIH